MAFGKFVPGGFGFPVNFGFGDLYQYQGNKCPGGFFFKPAFPANADKPPGFWRPGRPLYPLYAAIQNSPAART